MVCILVERTLNFSDHIILSFPTKPLRCQLTVFCHFAYVSIHTPGIRTSLQHDPDLEARDEEGKRQLRATSLL